MDKTLINLEKSIEKLTGISAIELRKTTIDKRRKLVEKEKGKLLFTTKFPFIGRGNVLGDRTLSNDSVNALVDSTFI